jgi:hypothetical protein
MRSKGYKCAAMRNHNDGAKETRCGFSLAPLALVLFGAIWLGVLAAGCGGGTSSTPSSGSFTTQLSDPNNQCTNKYSHVYVTISDVQASTSGSGNSGFVDITPGLSAAPIQVDLLAAPNAECFLAELGVASGLPPGDYQQIRIILVANNASGITLAHGETNQCGGSSGPWNCVFETGSTTSNELSLPSEAQTGIKIPPGQISGGKISLSSGQSVDIDIDFNACTSVVQAGSSGKFLLKPTLRAGEVGTNPLVAGTVVLATASNGTVTPNTSQPIANANIWLEQQPATANFTPGNPAATPGASPSINVETLVQTTTSDSNGHFEFCPVLPGVYDIVADAESMPSSNLPANATVAVGASVTTSGGPNTLVIPLVAEPSTSQSPPWGQIGAIVSTKNTSAPGDDVTLNALQGFTPPGSATTVMALIPLLYNSSATDGTMPAGVPPTVTTGSTFSDTNCPSLAGSSCAAGTNCVCFNLALPVSNVVVGSANTTGVGYTASAGGSVAYGISGVATVENGSSSDTVCTPSSLVTQGAFIVTPGAVTIPPNPLLEFTGCD